MMELGSAGKDVVEPNNQRPAQHYRAITAFHRGGGHKRLHRLLDFKRNQLKFPLGSRLLKLSQSFRSHPLPVTLNGERRYILAPEKAAGRRHVGCGDDRHRIHRAPLPLSSSVGTMRLTNIELKLARCHLCAAPFFRPHLRPRRDLCPSQASSAEAALRPGESVRRWGRCNATENVSWARRPDAWWVSTGSRVIAKIQRHPHGGGEAVPKVIIL